MELRRFAKRQGNCYPISLAAICNNPEWLLVHGLVDGATGRIDHAWVVKDDEVYDGVLNKRMDKFDYWFLYDPDPINIYTYAESMKLVTQTGHAGPWTDDEYIKAQESGKLREFSSR